MTKQFFSDSFLIIINGHDITNTTMIVHEGVNVFLQIQWKVPTNNNDGTPFIMISIRLITADRYYQ